MDAKHDWDDIGWYLDEAKLAILRGINERPSYVDVQRRGWEALTRHYFAEELRLRPEVDELARCIARRKPVVASVSPDPRYYLILRIQCAQDFLGMVFPPQSTWSPFADAPPVRGEADRIEWLLIDLWTRRFDHWLKLTAISLAGPFAFYGLDPADPNVES
jgi:hypothetical protein